MDTFSFSPPINLDEIPNCMLAITGFETFHFPSNKFNESNRFQFFHCVPLKTAFLDPEQGVEIIENLMKILKQRSQNDNRLLGKEVLKKEAGGYKKALTISIRRS